VKKGILLGFRYGEIKHLSRNEIFSFSDKQTYPTRSMEDAKNVRVVPGGTSIRTGSYIGENVVIMPPAYINTGSYIGSNTLVDSHVLVGSCAQIGSNIHLSAGTQIGGVLEPVGALPVIIEDDALIGGNCGIYEGTIVKKGAVIGAGTILTSSIPVYDLIRRKVIRASAGTPLVIPPNAVVVPGSRPITTHEFAKANGLHIYCGIIIKYKDDRTAAATTLEDDLRPSDKPDFTC
ncbi:MAG TPA: 2,3,4,5-tetrahydropyridine-2,6-dicarboxylate N-succinyltransferase, partial [Bacteroidetes bacterium]|nr:2,3,4,5-tetrahydropyridine-2,6-dicarboxylate N-succinyltransferase [Bacteroidota bacterium]